MNVIQLKQELQIRGCLITGNKSELLERLKSFLSNDNNDVIEILIDNKLKNINHLTVIQLKNELKIRNCTIAGTKKELLERLNEVK